MTRRRLFHLFATNPAFITAPALILAGALALPGCSTTAETATDTVKAAEPLAIATIAVESRAIDRYLRVTGSLMADAQADVSAETAGRVIETPVERGTRVSQGALLVRISPSETSAQLQEADANAAQIEARLGLVARSAVRSLARAGRDERQGIARVRRGGVQPHAVAGRPEGDLAERVRSAADPARGGAPELPGGAEHGGPVVPLARGGSGKGLARAQGGERHGGEGAAERARRRAPGQCR